MECTNKLFQCVEIYGLIIDYDTNTCTAHKLKMDFSAKRSSLYSGEQDIPLSEGVNRLLSTLQHLRQ